jgi:membrane associated rhomboid family serine protease
VFPIGDDNSDRRSKPLVTWALIAVNVLVFVAFQRLGTNDRFTYAFSTVPQEIRTGKDIVTGDREVEEPVTHERIVVPGLQPTPVPVLLTLLTAIFMHGGIAHLLGNMWFLLIFGDNVEDDLGRFRYLMFYLVTGVLASLAHVATTLALDGNPLIPSLGASGAISGVLAGYLVLHPRRRVRVMMLRTLTEVPGIVAVGIWFAFQIVSGLGMLGAGSQGGGVAYGAHVGGFVAGLVLVKVFALGRSREPRPRVIG